MTGDPHPDPVLENGAGAMDSAPPAQDDDTRSDLEQVVGARADAVKRGEGGPGPEDAPGDYSGNAGTGGEVKNQNRDAQ